MICTLAMLFLAMQALNPPPATQSSPLITVSIRSSTPHLSSLHHWKEVKIPRHHISSPPPLLHALIQVPSSSFPPLFRLVWTQCFTSQSRFFFLYLRVWNSHLSIFVLSITVLVYALALLISRHPLNPVASLFLEPPFPFLSGKWKIKIFN